MASDARITLGLTLPCPLYGAGCLGPSCSHHAMLGGEENWAASNRLYCDYFHRRRPLPRAVNTREWIEMTYQPIRACE